MGVLAVVVFLGGAAAFLLTRASSPTTSATRPGARSGRHRNSTPGQVAPSKAGTLEAVAISPRNGSVSVGSLAPIAVTLSAPIANDSPMPTLDPSVPGSWRLSRRTLTFTPTEPFVPLGQVTLTLPGGAGGLLATGGGTLRASVVDNFTIENGTTLRLQQLLSLLDCSPLSWSPSGTAIAPGDTAAQLTASTRRHRETSPGAARDGPRRSLGVGMRGPSTSSRAGS